MERIGFRWVLAAGVAIAALMPPAFGHETVMLRHVHGLGYSPDGRRIIIPNHQGLSIYDGGRWSKMPGPAHDFMGFAVTRKFIFSSGHVAPGGGRGASLGLIRSQDGGRSWTSLGFEGEAEFHLVAAGYESDALYVHNPAPNSRMPRSGLYRMAPEGVAWRGAEARGMRGELYKLAAHPTDEATIAAVTSEGLFWSRNGGDEFRPLIEGAEVRTAYFPLDGDSLWFGTFDGRPALFRLALADGARDEIGLPPIGRDLVAYVAQNPVRRAEFAMVTFERAVFLSPDRGKTWTRIARARGARAER